MMMWIHRHQPGSTSTAGDEAREALTVASAHVQAVQDAVRSDTYGGYGQGSGLVTRSPGWLPSLDDQGEMLAVFDFGAWRYAGEGPVDRGYPLRPYWRLSFAQQPTWNHWVQVNAFSKTLEVQPADFEPDS
jgi:hypothetical protein